MNMEISKIEKNIEIAKNIYKMTIKGEFVEKIKSAGQFINIKINKGDEYLLRRPISISKIDKKNKNIDIVYKVNGKGTKILSEMKKDSNIDLIAPLGNGYNIDTLKKGENALLVGGGIGIPPLYELARQFKEKGINIITILGFNSKNEVFYEKEFSELGEVHIATTDGTYKYKGFITDLIKSLKKAKQLNYDKYYSCGPLAMLKALRDTENEKIGYISVENRMACGIGACYACVCKKNINKSDLITYDKNKIYYTRVCYEGPVYLANEIEI